MLDPQRSDTALRNIDSYPAFRRALESHLFMCFFLIINCYPIHSLMHSRPYFVDWAPEHLLYCIVLYCTCGK